MAGLTDDGFEARSPQEFFETMRSEFEARTGETLDLTRSNVVVHMLVVVANLLGDLSESLQAIYDARDVNNATGLQLDALAATVGISRKPAQAATVPAQAFRGDINTVIPAGKQVEGGGPDGRLRWTLQEDVRIGIRIGVNSAAAGGWVVGVDIPSAGIDTSVTYQASSSDTVEDVLEGIRQKLLSKGDIDANLDAEIVDATPDPLADFLVVTSPKSVDFDVGLNSFPGGGDTVDGYGYGRIEADDKGAISAPQFAVDSIVTPVSGWDSTTNPIPAVGGRDRESDPELRIRVPQSLAIRGSATLPSIRANLLDLDFLSAVVVLDNPTNQTQTVQGVDHDPHTVGVVVYPSGLTDDEQKEVAATLYETLAAGIGTAKDSGLSTVTRTVKADDDTKKEIDFHYAQALQVSADIDLTLEDGYDSADVLPVVERQVEDYLKTRQVGDAARLLDIYGILDAIDGVQNVQTLELNGSSSDITPNATKVVTNNGVDVSTV